MVNFTKLDKFGYYLAEQNLSSNTINQYLCQVKLFLARGMFTENRLELFANINAFSSQGNKQFCMFAIKHLLYFIGMSAEWKEYYKKYGRNIKPKERRVLKKALTTDELIKVMGSLTDPYDLVLAVQYETGCRISALLGLRKEDTHLDNNGFLELSVREKGNLSRILLVTDKTIIERLQVKMTQLRPNENIFHFSTMSYNRHLRQASILTLNRKISSHYVRHSRGIQVYQATKDAMKVKELLGHKRLETTYTYLKSSGLLAKDIIMENQVSLSGGKDDKKGT